MREATGPVWRAEMSSAGWVLTPAAGVEAGVFGPPEVCGTRILPVVVVVVAFEGVGGGGGDAAVLALWVGAAEDAEGVVA